MLFSEKGDVMGEIVFSVAVGTGVAFAVTYYAMPYLIARFRAAGLTGVDGHKADKPEVPEMGGVGILAGYSLGLLAAGGLLALEASGFSLVPVYAALSVFLLAGLIGILDDLVKLHHAIKPVLLLFAAVPLIVARAGVPEIRFPFFTLDFASLGGFDLAFLYWLVVVPLAVTGTANISNMLAGFNGLMSGLGVIACGGLALVSAFTGNVHALLIFLPMMGAQLAFHRFNIAPAKIFPGDVGTLSLGALVAAGLVVGNMEFVGVLFFAPHLVNAVLSLGSVGGFFEEKRFRREKLSALDIADDGRISFTRLEKPVTLSKLLLYNKPQTEYAFVTKIHAIAFAAAVLVVAGCWWWRFP